MMRASMPRWAHGSLRAALIAVAIAVAGLVPLRAQDAGDEVREIAARGGYQINLPGAEAPASGSGTATRREATREALADPMGTIPRESAGDAQPVLWIVLGVVAAIAAVLGVRRATHRSRRDVSFRAGPASLAPALQDDLAAGTPLTEAEALAQSGRFAEAVRLLLTGTIDALRRHGTTSVPRSMTGRELARSTPLRDAVRGALVTLVDEVEQTLFAGRDAGAEDFARCVTAFQTLSVLHGEASR